MVSPQKDNHVIIRTENNISIELKSCNTSILKLADMAMDMHEYLDKKNDKIKKKQEYLG